MAFVNGPLAVIAILFFIHPIVEGNCHGQCLSYGVTGPLYCNSHGPHRPHRCQVESVQETGPITCDDLKALAADVDPTLYGGGANLHLVPMAHRYYYSRFNEAFGSCCPTNVQEIGQMALTTPWTAFPTGQAWDIGYRARALRRNCTFPTTEFPFICTGVDGTSGVDGSKLGNLYYIPLLTNNATTGAGVWALFGQCWDAVTPEDSTGSNSPVSWNVFTNDGTGVVSAGDVGRIRTKLADIGFPTSGPSFLVNTF